MTLDRSNKGTKGREAHSEMGTFCTSVRSGLSSFFDWAGYHDARRRAAWDELATRRVLDGESVSLVLESVKDKWYRHRRMLGLPMRNEHTEPEIGAELFGVTLAILEHKLSPAQAAVLFRSVERNHPTELAVRLCREACEAAGDSWSEYRAKKEAVASLAGPATAGEPQLDWEF